MNAAPDSRLTIQSLESDYRLAGERGGQWPVARELDRIARERLPALLAEAMPARLDDEAAVYRIRHIRVELALDRAALRAAGLERLWARGILRAVLDEVRLGTGENVVRFDNYGELVAAFVADRLRGVAWDHWVYEELQALRHVSAGEAIGELLAARPAYLRPVARRLWRTHQLADLPRRLGERQAQRLLRAAAGESSTPPEPAALLAGLEGRTGVPPPAGEGPSERALAVLLEDLAVGPEAGPALPVLARLSQDRVTVADWVADLPRALLGELAALPGRVPERLASHLSEPVRRLIAECREGPAARYLQRLVDEARRRAGPGPISPESPHRDTDLAPEAPDTSATAAPRAFFTPFAGLGLVLVVVRDLGLHRVLGPQALREVFTALVEARRRPLLAGDPLLPALFPLAAPPEALPDPWPPIAGERLQDLDPSEVEALGDLPPAEAYSRLLAARLARRLPGLAGSSLGYLRRELLERPGEVVVGEHTLELRLSPLPLAIVLRMAGLDGPLGRLPWLGERALTIHVEGG